MDEETFIRVCLLQHKSMFTFIYLTWDTNKSTLHCSVVHSDELGLYTILGIGESKSFTKMCEEKSPHHNNILSGPNTCII